MMNVKIPLLLIILDGWGYRYSNEHNAINQAHTPHWDQYWNKFPHALLEGSGHAVGLPEGQMGNSEVGHLHIGAGRIVDQDFTRIDKSILDHSFSANRVLVRTLNDAAKKNKAVHVMGLLSPGGVHSHERHFHALLELAAKHEVKKIYFHAFLDGRDVPPRSAANSLIALDSLCHTLKCGRIASLVGRYYAMDRDNRWDRIEQAYHLVTEGEAPYHANTALEALEQAYARQEDDEFIKPTGIGEPVKIENGDSIIFMNFRADRARQLSHAIMDASFPQFARKRVFNLSHFVSLTEYASDLKTEIAFEPQSLNNILGECIAKAGLNQLRIAETEKYAHVTYFFNGGVEKALAHEDRILIHSPKVATYDLKPEMSAIELTDKLIEHINRQHYDVIICNYANADMVGHSGNFEAAIEAIEVLDDCLHRVISAMQAIGGEVLITADHGNAECMYDDLTQQPHTAHTSDPVPFLYIGQRAHINREYGSLIDIAPTILTLLNLPIPKEMTGKTLLMLDNHV